MAMLNSFTKALPSRFHEGLFADLPLTEPFLKSHSSQKGDWSGNLKGGYSASEPLNRV